MDIKAPTKVVDSHGKEWTMHVNAGSIMKACRGTGLSIMSLMDMKIELEHILAALPFFCEDAIKEEKMTHDDFLARFGIKELMDITVAFFPAMAEAFPSEEDAPTGTPAEGVDDAPLPADGPAQTS